MSTEDLEEYENRAELSLYREYKDVVGIFTYAVETERRFYLCNAVDLKVRTEGSDVYYEVSMADAWGVGHVSTGAIRQDGEGAHLPRRVHRGDRTFRAGGSGGLSSPTAV